MKPEKHNSCDTSSEEISDQSKNVSDENPNPTVVSRSYDCAFCKRGFTNAQALGGHMNIHRKDKSKNKKKDLEEPSMNSGQYFPAVSSNDQQKQSTICYTGMGAELGFQVYLPSPNSNPSFFTHEIHNLGSPNTNILPSAWKPQCLITSHNDRLDSSLSLGIGPSVVEDEGGKENEVDLELRLGQPTRDHSERAHKRETVYME